MWQSDPAWRELPGGHGPATVGVWTTAGEGRRWVVKRLARPSPGGGALDDPGYWRREVEVALDPSVVAGPGLVPAEFGRVEEDDEGVTVFTAEVPGPPPPGPMVARALGRFAAAPYDARPWLARDLIRQRVALAGARGGWPTLQRTTLADVCHRLWQVRERWLDRAEELPAGRMHGDAVPSAFVGHRGGDVVAVDWQCLGVGPIGTDLGYYSLSTRESLEVLLDAFCAGVEHGGGDVDRAEVLLAARVAAVYTVVTRAEWALAHAARGEGALAGKFRHPSVAPHLRALQRQFAQVEALVA